MENEILREVWRNRDEFAKRCNYNLDLMAETLRKVERSIGNPLVDRSKKTPAHRSGQVPRSRRR